MLGLDSSCLLERNPRFVYAGFHGVDTAGPYRGRAAYDDIIQGLSGSADILGRQFGTPAYFPSIVADKTSGLIGAIAILAAVVKRERSEEHTSELQSLMRISYAVFCLKKKKNKT